MWSKPILWLTPTKIRISNISRFLSIYKLKVSLTLRSSNSYRWMSFLTSEMLRHSFSKNVTSHSSILVTVSSSCSLINTYSLECLWYLIKIHFFPLEPNFPCLWDGLWIYTADPQRHKWARSCFLSIHISYRVELIELLGTRLNI